MKKILCVFLTAVLLCSAVVYVSATEQDITTVGYDAARITTTVPDDAVNILNVTTDTYASQTTSNFYIDSAEGLTRLSELVNAGTAYDFYSKSVYLKNNIDMSGVTDFEPIGQASGDSNNPAPRFRGTFDGQGYEIQNLTVTSSTRVCNALFGAVRGATIRNLVIAETCSFSYTGSSTGRTAALVAMVGVNGGDAYSTGTVNGTSFDYAVLIENILNKADVSTTRSGVGGLVGGGAYGTNRYLYIRNCTNAGSVTNGTDSAGGICARLESTNRGVIIENCLNTGNVTSPACAAGMLADIMSSTLATRIVGCVNTGRIISNFSAGAILGKFRQSNTCVSNCTNYGYVESAQASTIYGERVNGNTANITDTVDKYTGSAELYGYQVSAAGQATQSIRLVASIDNLEYNRVGFLITVKDSDGNTVRNIDQKCATVYKSLTGMSGGTILQYSADVTEQEGDTDGIREGGYLYALSIKNIPASEGELTFEVTPFFIKDGYTSYGETSAFTHEICTAVEVKN